MNSSHDVVVVGGGPGGYAAALYGAAAGLDVALVEKQKLGGTCLHVGCIPAKELLETASVYRTVAHADQFGITAPSPTVDMAAAQARKQKIVDQLHTGVGKLLEGRKVTLIDGWGSLGSDRAVSVSGGESGEMTLTADHVIVATGSVPRMLPGFEVDGERVFTSDELLSITDLPEQAAIIGGGAIGLEFASMLADLGSKVTVLEALPRILLGADDDVVKMLTRAFKKRKIEIRTGVAVTGCRLSGDGVALDIDGDDPLSVDAVVVCVGRSPFTDGLGLDDAGVETDDGGYVVVDEHCQTASPGCTRWATWFAPRSWPTWHSPRPSWWSSTCWVSRLPRWTMTECRGPSTATPRWPSWAIPRHRPKRPVSRWPRRYTGLWATGGP